MQNGDGGGRARAKGTRGYVGRSISGNEAAAAGAADRMIVVRGDFRAHDRDIPHELGLDGAGIPAQGRQRVTAGRADLRIMIPHLIDLIGVGVGALMARMARLAAGLPSAGHARRARRCRGWVGRGRFGRVLGMLLQTGGEISHLRVEVHQLLLLLIHHRQHGTNEVPHGQGGSGPGVGRNTSRWWRVVHAPSMPNPGAVVKWGNSVVIQRGHERLQDLSQSY